MPADSVRFTGAPPILAQAHTDFNNPRASIIADFFHLDNPPAGSAPGAAVAALNYNTVFQHQHHHNSTNQTLHPATSSSTSSRAKPGSIIHKAPIAHGAGLSPTAASGSAPTAASGSAPTAASGSAPTAESGSAPDTTDIKNVIQHIEPTPEQQKQLQDKPGKDLLLIPPVPTPTPALAPASSFVHRYAWQSGKKQLQIQINVAGILHQANAGRCLHEYQWACCLIGNQTKCKIHEHLLDKHTSS